MIMISLKLNEKRPIVIYEFLIFLWIVFILLNGFSREWIMVFVTIFIIYILANLLSYRKYRLVIPPITCIFVLLFIFRIDELIMNSFVVDQMIFLTSVSLNFVLKYGSTAFMFTSVLLFWYFRSKKGVYLGNKTKKVFYFISLLFLGLVISIDYISKFDIIMIDSSTFEFKGSSLVSRISIIDSCSGIFSLLIFFSCFLLFINLTKLNHKLDNGYILGIGSLGAFGIFLMNLFRIFILILLNLIFSVELMQEAHIYLGGILIIAYLSIYWSLIWSELPVQTKNKCET